MYNGENKEEPRGESTAKPKIGNTINQSQSLDKQSTEKKQETSKQDLLSKKNSWKESLFLSKIKPESKSILLSNTESSSLTFRKNTTPFAKTFNLNAAVHPSKMSVDHLKLSVEQKKKTIDSRKISVDHGAITSKGEEFSDCSDVSGFLKNLSQKIAASNSLNEREKVETIFSRDDGVSLNLDDIFDNFDKTDTHSACTDDESDLDEHCQNGLYYYKSISYKEKYDKLNSENLLIGATLSDINILNKHFFFKDNMSRYLLNTEEKLIERIFKSSDFLMKVFENILPQDVPKELKNGVPSFVSCNIAQNYELKKTDVIWYSKNAQFKNNLIVEDQGINVWKTINKELYEFSIKEYSSENLDFIIYLFLREILENLKKIHDILSQRIIDKHMEELSQYTLVQEVDNFEGKLQQESKNIDLKLYIDKNNSEIDKPLDLSECLKQIEEISVSLSFILTDVHLVVKQDITNRFLAKYKPNSPEQQNLGIFSLLKQKMKF